MNLRGRCTLPIHTKMAGADRVFANDAVRELLP